jgi:hypothetical protein
MKPEKIIEYLDKNKERWATGLTYMADERLEDPFKTAEAHLTIIMDDIKNYLWTFHA